MLGLFATLTSIFIGPEFLRAFKAVPFGVWDFMHTNHFQSIYTNKGYGQQRFEDELRVVNDIEQMLYNDERLSVFDSMNPLQVGKAVVFHLNHAILKMKRSSLEKMYQLVPKIDFEKIGIQLAEHFVDEHKQVIIHFFSANIVTVNTKPLKLKKTIIFYIFLVGQRARVVIALHEGNETEKMVF
jgi:hypothetical protein